MISEKIFKLTGVLAVLGVLLPNLSLAQSMAKIDQKTQWQFYKDIRISDNPAKGDLVKITLDQDVFSNAKQDLGDLRITADGVAEIPYKLIVERSAFSQENIYPVNVLNNSYNSEGGYNVFIVDFGQGGFLNSSINILIDSENFKRTVAVSGSNDMADWNILKINGYIYDYTDRVGNFKAQSTAVNYPENAFRYIQIKIYSGGDSPLSISGAQISKIKKSESKESVFNPRYEVRENSAKKITEIIVDLGKKGWPTSNITLASPNENFNRETVVYESNDGKDWRRVGQSYIFNYNTPKFVGSNLEVAYSETRERYLKIEVYNGDNSPISIAGISAKTILRSIAFQYGVNTANREYRLYYGNSKANFPEYDLEKFFPYLDTGKYFNSTLSSEQVNAFYEKEIPPVLPVTERIPYLVSGVLVLAIAMMGFMVFKFIKKVGTDKK